MWGWKKIYKRLENSTRGKGNSDGEHLGLRIKYIKNLPTRARGHGAGATTGGASHFVDLKIVGEPRFGVRRHHCGPQEYGCLRQVYRKRLLSERTS